MQRTPVSALRTWRALTRRWEKFAMVLHHHHAGEDAGIWPLLLERATKAADSSGVATLRAMEAEHGEIDDLLVSCATGFTAMGRGGGEAQRSDLERVLADARDRLRGHLAHEERDALELVQRYLTPADWKAISREHFEKTAKPAYWVFAPAWALHRLPQDAKRRVVDGVGRGIAVAAAATRPPFTWLQRAAFRYV